MATEVTASQIPVQTLPIIEPDRQATYMARAENPCLACSIGQDCCSRLSGLRLAPREFERCFAVHADRIDVGRDGPLYVVSSRNGGACPNWSAQGCAIYDLRPMECRLFPHTIYMRNRAADRVSVVVHSDTRCPQKEKLKMTDAAARGLVAEFCREAFPGAVVEMHMESRFERLRRVFREILVAVRRAGTRLRPRRNYTLDVEPEMAE
jgi:Fe-S-cluster containining protein